MYTWYLVRINTHLTFTTEDGYLRTVRFHVYTPTVNTYLTFTTEDRYSRTVQFHVYTPTVLILTPTVVLLYRIPGLSSVHAK